jgi:hypothetical protein
MSSLAPNLFDKRFQDLLQIGRALLPSLAPDWTDHNAHDPGITLMELLAWVAEAQLYSLGHMRRDERAAYAAMLGILPGGTKGAHGLIWPDRSDPRSPLTTYSMTMVLSKDTVIKLAGADSPTFRPSNTLLWVPGRITALLTRLGDGQTIDHTSANGRGVAWLPFGERAGRRDVLAISFKCRDEAGLFGVDRQNAKGAHWAIGVLAAPPLSGGTAAPGEPGPHFQSRLKATLIVDNERVALRIASDTTQGLLSTGAILLDLDDVATSPRDEFTIELSAPGGFARPPRLLRIEPNVIPIEQGQAISREAHQANGEPDLNITLKESGLQFVAGQHPITLEVDEPSGSATWYLFGIRSDLAHELNSGRVPASLHKQFQEHDIILAPTAVIHTLLAGNKWTIVDADQTYLIVRESQMLNVYKTWSLCDRLSEHGSDENVYEVDARTGQITFGNGVNGRIPPAGSQVFVTYTVSDGEQGNVARNRKWKVAGIEGVSGINLDPITGGASPSGWIEERHEARRRFRDDHALVTAEDIAAAALALPLLEVARAWVVPPNANGPQTGVLTLVALRSRQNNAEPEQIPETARWLEAIRRSLSARMPLGIRLAVVAPRYTDFSTQVVLEAHPRLDPKAIEDTVIKELGKRFTLDGRAEGATPRQPGVPVTKRDLAAWLRAIAGVKRVVKLQLLDANGQDGPKISVLRNGLPRWNSGHSTIDVKRSGSGSTP